MLFQQLLLENPNVISGADVLDIHVLSSLATIIVPKESLLVECAVKQKNPGLPEMVTRDKHIQIKTSQVRSSH